MHVLILCSANRCRSVMAETVLRHQAAQVDWPLFVASAGLHVERGQPADPMTVRLLQRRGYAPRVTHCSRTLQEMMHIAWDCVLVMDEAQRQTVLARYPQLNRRVFLLHPDDLTALADPYRQGWLACQNTLNHIEDMTQQWLGRWMAQSAQWAS